MKLPMFDQKSFHLHLECYRCSWMFARSSCWMFFELHRAARKCWTKRKRRTVARQRRCCSSLKNWWQKSLCQSRMSSIRFGRTFPLDGPRTIRLASFWRCRFRSVLDQKSWWCWAEKRWDTCQPSAAQTRRHDLNSWFLPWWSWRTFFCLFILFIHFFF